MIHVAEAIAGVPYAIEHPTVVEVNGTPQIIGIAETDHCCMGFRKLDPWLDVRGLIRRGPIGNAQARLASARDLVDVALERLRADPLVFLCEPGAGCEECDAARSSSSGGHASVHLCDRRRSHRDPRGDAW